MWYMDHWTVLLKYVISPSFGNKLTAKVPLKKQHITIRLHSNIHEDTLQSSLNSEGSLYHQRPVFRFPVLTAHFFGAHILPVAMKPILAILIKLLSVWKDVLFPGLSFEDPFFYTCKPSSLNLPTLWKASHSATVGVVLCLFSSASIHYVLELLVERKNLGPTVKW